jgi:hypothetical protein
MGRASMGDVYGIRPGTIPGFAVAGGGSFVSVTGLPGRTIREESSTGPRGNPAP